LKPAAQGRSHEPQISIVIAAKNEARNLERILPRLSWADEIVIVDGHSVDGTVEVARRLAPHAKIVRQTRRGRGNALACGLDAASGDIIVTFDADGNADLATAALLLAELVDGADFARGGGSCCAFWTDLVAHFGLPSPQTTLADSGTTIWGDGAEVADIIGARIHAVGLRSVELADLAERIA